MIGLRRMWVLTRRELAGYFFSPLAWVVLTLFLLVQGYSFYIYVELVNRPDAPRGTVMQFFFGGTFLYWLFVIFIVSVITMRLVAEERRSGTVELLLTAPVTEAQVVLGKYIAAVLFYAFLWLPTVAYAGVMASVALSPLAWGPVAAAYLGTLTVGAACIAVGLLCSVLCRNQIVAAVLTFTSLSLLLLFGALEAVVSRPGLRRVVEYLNLFAQMEEFASGIVDTRRLVFHFTLVLLCLTAAARALERRKWR